MMTRRPYRLATRTSLRCGVVGTASQAGLGRRLAPVAGTPAIAGWQGHEAGAAAEGLCFFSKDNDREVLPT